EPFGRLLLARWNFHSEVDKPRTNVQIGQRTHDGAVELSDDILGRALGGENPDPAHEREPSEPGFLRSRNIGHGGQSLPGGYRNGFDTARPHIRNHTGVAEHEVNLASDQILYGGTGSAIGHVLKTGTCEILEQNAREVSLAAHTGSTKGRSVWIGF